MGYNDTMPTWYQIRCNNTLTGWVHGTYAQTYGNLSPLPNT